MARAWVFQATVHKRRYGEKAPWSVGWIDPDGKRRSKKIGSRSMATKHARKLEGQLTAGTYQQNDKKTWKQFRAEYERLRLPRLAPRTQKLVIAVADTFERIVKPVRLSGIRTTTIEDFVAKRSKEGGKRKGSLISPAAVNLELRHLKAMIRVAKKWGYLSEVPQFDQLREHEEIGDVITEAHFKAIYEACDDAAKLPKGLHCPPGQWWKSLLVFALTTGWRISEILAFRREDLDLETGAITTRARDNKGKREARDYLTDAALAHVREIVSDKSPMVFHWPHHLRTLYAHFHAIQKAAGVELHCDLAGEHECGDSCCRYGFHSLRRGYATLNAENLPAPVLQRKMRHRSFTTTLKYIELADKIRKATDAIHVPQFLLEGEK